MQVIKASNVVQNDFEVYRKKNYLTDRNSPYMSY